MVYQMSKLLVSSCEPLTLKQCVFMDGSSCPCFSVTSVKSNPNRLVLFFMFNILIFLTYFSVTSCQLLYAAHVWIWHCYAQLCLPWIPMNHPLWIPVPSASVSSSDVRITTWPYPSYSLADIWFIAFWVTSHTALCYTHILIILK